MNDWTKYGRVADTFGKTIFPIAGNILEIGCSWGETTRELLELSPTSFVMALDLNPDLINKAKITCARFNTRAEFLVEDGYNLSHALANHSIKKFAAIFVMNNFAYSAKEMSRETRTSVCDQLFDHLTESGILLISASTRYIILNNQRKCIKKLVSGDPHRLFYVFVDNID